MLVYSYSCIQSELPILIHVHVKMYLARPAQGLHHIHVHAQRTDQLLLCFAKIHIIIIKQFESHDTCSSAVYRNVVIARRTTMMRDLMVG